MYLATSAGAWKRVLSVTQSGLRTVVNHWDGQSAAMCRQLHLSHDNLDNSAPYGFSREGYFASLHTDEGVQMVGVHFNGSENLPF